MTVAEVVEQARTLSPQERKELVRLLVDSLAVTESTETSRPQHSIMELAGLGAEIWEGIDAEEYVNQLRNEWDNRMYNRLECKRV